MKLFSRYRLPGSLCLLGLLALSTPNMGVETRSIKSLIESQITGVEGHKLLMSEVVIPAHLRLDYHTHENEEFLYIMKGSAKLLIDGKEDQTLTAGEAVVIPAGVIHTAETGDVAATALIVRVHPDGKPVATPATPKHPK